MTEVHIAMPSPGDQTSALRKENAAWHRRILAAFASSVFFVVLGAIALKSGRVREMWVLAIFSAAACGCLMTVGLMLVDRLRMKADSVGRVLDEMEREKQRAVLMVLDDMVRDAMRKGDEADRKARRPEEASTAIGAVVTERRTSQMIATAFMMLGWAGHVVVGLYFKAPIGAGTIMFGLAITLLTAAALALDYRVERGLYGTNENEAREIIAFVLKNAEDLDLTGGLGARDMQVSPELERAVSAVWAGARV